MEPGQYVLEHDAAGVSYPFRIDHNVHHKVAAAALKAFYYNRASTALPEQYAGIWNRPAGHPDNNVILHASDVTEQRPAGFRFDSSKGWYNVGDFNKYIVNSGISTYTLMAAWEHFPEYYRLLGINIPETGNGIPDILNEARWNLDWMLTMQDPHDGGVYHKLTSANFAGMVMPHQNNVSRYAVMKSTAATLNFAAVMAVAARVYEEFDPHCSASERAKQVHDQARALTLRKLVASDSCWSGTTLGRQQEARCYTQMRLRPPRFASYSFSSAIRIRSLALWSASSWAQPMLMVTGNTSA